MTIFKIQIEPEKIAPAWAVYILRDAHNAIQFIGHCRLSQLLTMPDARANPFWHGTFPPGRPLTLELIETQPNRALALHRAWQLIGQYGRPFMQSQNRYAGRAVPVVCNETGEQFATISEACHAHGLTMNALSKHLNHKPGFATVRGKTYSRAAAVPLHSQQPAVPLHSQQPAVPLHSQGDEG